MKTAILLILLVGNIYLFRREMINTFKIAYYETKLKNRGVDISHVENITLREIIKID